MTPEAMQKICEDVFGKRSASGKQEPTGAVGAWGDREVDGKTVFFIAKQGGPMPPGLTPTDKAVIWDARDHVVTKLGKSEWTGYHAEMIIVSAMLKTLHAGKMWKTGDNANASAMGKYNAFLGTVIAANAACCKHCHAMLVELGIKRPDPAGDPSLTGWWNPLTDEVFPNGSAGFLTDLPGGGTPSGLPAQMF
jgi:hypothetical protein